MHESHTINGLINAQVRFCRWCKKAIVE